MRKNVSLLAINLQPPLAPSVSKIANMSIGDNIRTLRKEKGWTQEELARRVNVSRGRIAQIEKDPATDVKADTLLSLAKALGCLPEHLRYGWGTNQPTQSPQFVNVPVLDVELAAGTGTHIDLEQVHDWVPISQEWVFQNGLSEGSLAVVKVRGDSMMPTLNDGDTILIDTSDTQLVSEKIYAIAFDGELRVKRMIKQFGGTWKIRSDNIHNPAYTDETVSQVNIGQLRIIGRVVTLLMRNM